MYGTLEIFQLAQGLAKNASTRQSVIAGNIANADTPGFRAKDVASFADTYQADTQNKMRVTRAGHQFATEPGEQSANIVDRPGPSSPNGNTVSLETEMMKAVEIRHDHEMALSVYQTSLGILRTSLGRGR